MMSMIAQKQAIVVIVKNFSIFVGHVETQGIPQRIHLSPFLFGRSAASSVSFQKESLYRSPELVELFPWSEIFRIFRDQFGTLAFVYRRYDTVRVCHCAFPYSYHISLPDCSRRLYVCPVDPYLASLAGIGRIASGLVDPYRPQVFVYSDFFCHIPLS